MLGKSASEVKYLVALSNGANATAGSTNASNFAGYEWATLLIADASAPAGAVGMAIDMKRSGTSNGTFAGFGASITYNAMRLNGLYVRSFPLNSSATWYRVSYDNNNGASSRPTIIVALGAARYQPVTTQALDTVLFENQLGG